MGHRITSGPICMPDFFRVNSDGVRPAMYKGSCKHSITPYQKGAAMNPKHTILSSLSNHLAGAISALAKLSRRVGAKVVDYVLVAGQHPSPVRSPEIAAFTALAAERAKRRAAQSQAAPAAALLASATLTM
jgi:hypothetical protein